MDSGDLPNWHSTLSAHADVAAATVHAGGHVDLSTVDLLHGVINVLLLDGCTDITLDLADVVSIDASGVRLVHDVHTELRQEGGGLRVANARPSVRDALTDGPAGVRFTPPDRIT